MTLVKQRSHVRAPILAKKKKKKSELTDEQLVNQLQPIIQSPQSAELTVIHLMLEYSFDLSHLKRLLAGKLLIVMYLALH